MVFQLHLFPNAIEVKTSLPQLNLEENLCNPSIGNFECVERYADKLVGKVVEEILPGDDQCKETLEGTPTLSQFMKSMAIVRHFYNLVAQMRKNLTVFIT